MNQYFFASCDYSSIQRQKTVIWSEFVFHWKLFIFDRSSNVCTHRNPWPVFYSIAKLNVQIFQDGA